MGRDTHLSLLLDAFNVFNTKTIQAISVFSEQRREHSGPTWLSERDVRDEAVPTRQQDSVLIIE